MKLETERKEQEKKKSPKVDFISAGTQQAAVLAAAKISMSVSGTCELLYNLGGSSSLISIHLGNAFLFMSTIICLKCFSSLC